MVVLSQIHRAPEPPPNVKPTDLWKYAPKLHNLKDSGALEEDAYIVMILFPYPGENVEKETVRYVCSIAKHRGGPTGDVDLVFKKTEQHFESY